MKKEMSHEEYLKAFPELMERYEKCNSSPCFNNPKRWKHDFYYKNGKRAMTVYENK